MTFKKKLVLGASALTILLSQVATAGAVTMFSSGATVDVATRTATFDSLTSNGIDLSAYTENMMMFSVNDISYQGFNAFTPGDGRTTGFHYGSGGNNSYVTITATDNSVFGAFDFLLGDGQNPQPTNVTWEAYLNGVLTGSGLESGVARGTVMGWYDLFGFDELRVAAASSETSPGWGNHQSIAIDDFRAGSALASNPVPVPAALPLFGTGLAIMGIIGWRRKRKVAPAT